MAYGKMPHEWEAAPGWSKAMAIAVYVTKSQMEGWEMLPDDRKARRLSNHPLPLESSD